MPQAPVLPSLEEIRRRAALLEQARSGLAPGADPRAVEDYRAALDAMYPQAWYAVSERVRAGDASAVEWPIRFIEADARCFRSGYEKERLCRFLPRCQLSTRDRRRLASAVEAALGDASRPHREQKAFRRLASFLEDSVASVHP